jgi:citrate lyase subunit beta/citryl-CoA lyase
MSRSASNLTFIGHLAARAYRPLRGGWHFGDFKICVRLSYACRLGRDMGLMANHLVHPAQIAYNNDAKSHW